MSSTKISIETTVKGSTQKAWNFYTMPKHIVKWNFASDDWHCPQAENDLRIGGKMKSRMEAKDGSFGFDFEAIYDEVDNLKKIAYTMPDGRKVVTFFEGMGDITKLTTTFDADGAHPIEMQKNGWQAILGNYKKYIESNHE